MNNSFFIVGLGKFGTTLARRLAGEGKQVVVIDRDKAAVSEIADAVTNAVTGDPTKEDALVAAGARNCDTAIVCIASDVDDSTLITLLLKDKLKIERVIARAGSENHALVLEKVGADQIVFPEQDAGDRLGLTLSRAHVREYIEFSANGRIVDMNIPKRWVGKSIAELDLRRRCGVTAIAVTDNEEKKINLSPDPYAPLREGDTIALIGSREDIEKVSR